MRDKRREDAVGSEIDQLSEYDGSSDNESAVEEDVENGQNEVLNNSYMRNKELKFLFAAGRTRSGRVVNTSSRAMLWM